jgi:aminoglycoside 6-adenylyltransferase
MIPVSDAYQRLEQHFAAWASTQPAIAAVIVVGSQARTDHPADEWSDLDLVVFAHEATLFLQDPTWLNAFGAVVAVISNSFGQHDREWIALYADGCKLDVAFLSVDPAATPTLQAMLDVFPYPVVLLRGVRVLIDKTNSSAELHLPTSDAPPLPTQVEFSSLINRMALDAIKTAKFIRRSDLWRAKQLCDGEMKQHLLIMLEWQAAAQKDQRDIWYDGRFLAEWADGAAWAELPRTFAAFKATDLSRALLATLDLFRHLAREVAERLHLTYPDEIDRFVDRHIRAAL